MLYVAYGSNLHPQRLQARVPAARLLGSGRLAGWALHFHKRGADGSGKGDIVDADGSVHVAVYAINEAGVARLDDIEGPGYVRTAVRVAEFGDCFTYVARRSHVDGRLQPYDWYRELVLLGGRHLGFPAHYLAGIDAVLPVADPCDERRRANWSLVERLRNGG